MSEDDAAGASSESAPPVSRAVRVFISYAHDSEAHREAVRDLWVLLRANGIDAQLDRVAAQRRQDWVLWMMDQVRDADHILVIGSVAYKRRAEGRAEPDEGGVSSLRRDSSGMRSTGTSGRWIGSCRWCCPMI